MLAGSIAGFGAGSGSISFGRSWMPWHYWYARDALFFVIMFLLKEPTELMG
jgi:hypothetical protein